MLLVDTLHSGSAMGFDDDEEPEDAQIYDEMLEEDAAKKRAAALEALGEISTGQVCSPCMA